ncbi:hypothetical protein P171DRAFT_238215 [Karstenula rhodostoma CBS 690.94]|uniref:Uncharacterized protein n=1 Tax=Karstenula rhodostoma CBS 690.94 TaxID=1392251 RepID=A0A9P4PM51_9PLEO|nr:hypothetical protein P171DRAFT_238215 [Karstenula rhodostoma CBS 690.94]
MPKRNIRQTEACKEGEPSAMCTQCSDEQQSHSQEIVRASTPDSTPLPVQFWPDDHHRGLPLELRLQIYDEVATTTFARFPCFRNPGTKMFYEYNAYALALLRNGTAWENDAAASLHVPRATEAVRILADAVSFTFRQPPTLRPPLLVLLKDIEAMHSTDQEDQQPSGGPRSWSAPIDTEILKWGYVIAGGDCRVVEKGHLVGGRNAIGAKQLAQAIILQLRRSPVIRVRIFLDGCVPWCCHGSIWENTCIGANVKNFLDRVRECAPGYRRTGIRTHVTFITRAHRLEHWKEKLGVMGKRVEWDVASKEELDMLEA